MKMRLSALGAVAVQLSLCGDVLDRFASPPPEHRPETWLQVSGGNASKEGMTLDLEAISSAGFMGVQFFHESFRDPGPWPGTKEQIPCMSGKWEDFIAHTAKECRRLGLRFMMHGCPGWSMAGGPWIPDDKTMREIVVSRIEVSGGGKLPTLPRPEKADDAKWRDYRDIAVIAFPTPKGDSLKPLIPADVIGDRTIDHRTVKEYYSDPTVHAELDDEATSRAKWMKLAGGGEQRVGFTNSNSKVSAILDFGSNVVVRTVEISPVQRFNHFWSFQPDVNVLVFAEDKSGWRQISRRKMPQSTWQDEKCISLALPATSARRFKVVFEHEHPLVLSSLRFFSGARPDNWEAESARTLRALMDGGDIPLQANDAVDQDRIIDLTRNHRGNGQVDWTIPEGNWTILRIGNVNSGLRNHPAPPEATGWECDKLSKSGVDVHFAGFIGKLTSPSGPLHGGLLGGMLMDSWECEAQTWTPGLDSTFQERWGYSLGKWWPALVGYIVKDRRSTSSFYRDWRELLGDLVFENFYGHMAKKMHDRGMAITYETCGGDVLPADPMKHWKYADEPMCEFWRPRTRIGGVGSPDYKAIRPCVSASRIYGKGRASAEAICCTALDWRSEYLRAWKADFDYYTALGISHMVFENYTHDPRVGDLPPGTGYGSIMGSILMRGQTWWPAMRHFNRYLARCSYMLESGRNVSDVLLYLGDRVNHKPYHHLPFPKGFSYDYLNKDALLSRFSVKNGLWTTPEGLTWKALWLYDDRDLRPETVRKLAEAERDGGKIIRGDIFEGIKGLALRPQLREDSGLLWQHRSTPEEEIYFFCEESGNPFSGFVEVDGVGEVFVADPVTGETKPASDVSFDDGYAKVKLDMGRSGAVFLVVRKGTARPVAPKEEACSTVRISGEWKLEFEKGWGRDEPLVLGSLASWHELDGSEEQKSYSGSVDYGIRFDVGANEAKAAKVVLDLGEVENVAEVEINGKPAGLRWTWPYEFDATGMLREGANVLKVKVTGSWHNRLRFDAMQPEGKRKTWTLGWPGADSPLQPSGLLGPVTLKIHSK